MKKLLISALFFVFITGFAQENPIALINVTGKGTVKVVPDEVIIKARIEHTGKAPKEVKAQNDKVVNEIIKYLKSQGIPAKNFQTEYMRLSKDYNYNSKETSYSANQAISIKLEDLSNYENIMSGLLESGLNRIDGIQFKSSKKDELESEARNKAMLDAQRKAKELANAIGQDIGKAQSISEVGGGNYPQPMYKAAMMDVAEEESAETIAPGEMEVTIRVNVAFILQ